MSKKKYHLFVCHNYCHSCFDNYQYMGSFVELDETMPYIKDVELAEIFEIDTDGGLKLTHILDTALSEYGLSIPVNVWRLHEIKEGI